MPSITTARRGGRLLVDRTRDCAPINAARRSPRGQQPPSFVYSSLPPAYLAPRADELLKHMELRGRARTADGPFARASPSTSRSLAGSRSPCGPRPHIRPLRSTLRRSASSAGAQRFRYPPRRLSASPSSDAAPRLWSCADSMSPAQTRSPRSPCRCSLRPGKRSDRGCSQRTRSRQSSAR